MMKNYYVYILTSYQGALYIGVTNDLVRRLFEHKEKVNPKSFSARYSVNRLVYFEVYSEIRDARAREAQLKGWRREKKIDLIKSFNTAWRDLSLDWE